MQTLRTLLGSVNSRSNPITVITLAVIAALLVQMTAPQISGFAPRIANASMADLNLDHKNSLTPLEKTLAEKADPNKLLNQTPMDFTLNQGQTDAHVKFTARGRGYGLFLTANEAVMTFRQPQSQQTSALRLQLLQANLTPEITGLDRLPTVSNYYVGGDPKKYRENVPHYAKVKYAQMYPGIDLLYYGNQHQLEYDFVVAPGANPNDIKMRFTGASKLRVAENGDLVMRVKGHEVRHHKPFIYQTNAAGERREIAGRYILQPKNHVRFAIGEYDKTRELVIDPLTYSTYLGGYEGDEKAFAISVGGCTGACASYITGEVASVTFPDTTLVGQNGGTDVFVAKMNATGTGLSFFTFFGGPGNDVGRGIEADAAGYSYVVGLMGSGFVLPAGHNGFRTTDPSASSDDGFAVKFGPAGNLLNFTYLGGAGYDQVNAVVLNGTDVCVTGQTYSPDFPVVFAADTPLDTSYNGGMDAFVSVLSGDLVTLNYSTFLGGGNMDYGNGIDTYNGLLYVVGNTQSSGFPTSANAFDKTLQGFAPVDAFVARIDPKAGAAGLQYSTFLGGIGREYGYGIAVNKTNGQFYITGRSHSQGANASGYNGTTATSFPVTTATAYQTAQVGFGDVFVTRFNVNGGIVYSTLLGGSDYETAYGIKVSGANVYLTGETDSTDFPLVSNFYSDAPGTDAFVVRLNTNVAGAAGLTFSTYFGGGNLDAFDSVDSGRAIALAGAQIYVAGYTNATRSEGLFPITLGGVYQEDLAGGSDCFVARMTP